MTQAASGIDLFIPEVYDIVWSLIILVIVAVFFYKFFMPKFNAIFDERAAKIQGNIAKAEQARKDAAGHRLAQGRGRRTCHRPGRQDPRCQAGRQRRAVLDDRFDDRRPGRQEVTVTIRNQKGR